MHKTEYVKHERDIAAEMDPGDILIIAGGDSTVQNVLTALNRRPDFEKDFKNIPIGIIPLGATNSIWHQFSGKDEHSFKKPYTRGMRMVESAQMIIEGHNKPTDVLALTNEDERTVNLRPLSLLRFSKKNFF
jgi:diacylglycerol kinase family enzyme